MEETHTHTHIHTPIIREGEKNRIEKNAVPRNRVIRCTARACYIRAFNTIDHTHLNSVVIETLHHFMSIHWFDFHVTMIASFLLPSSRSTLLVFFPHVAHKHFWWEGVEKLVSTIDLFYLKNQQHQQPKWIQWPNGCGECVFECGRVCVYRFCFVIDSLVFFFELERPPR